jgi:hypothetical protein
MWLPRPRPAPRALVRAARCRIPHRSGCAIRNAGHLETGAKRTKTVILSEAPWRKRRGKARSRKHTFVPELHPAPVYNFAVEATRRGSYRLDMSTPNYSPLTACLRSRASLPLPRPSAPGLSVDECVRRLKRYHYAFKRLHEYLPRAPHRRADLRTEDGFLSLHAHYCAEHPPPLCASA